MLQVSSTRQIKPNSSSVVRAGFDVHRLLGIGFVLTLLIGLGLAAATLRVLPTGSLETFNQRFADTMPTHDNWAAFINALRYRLLGTADDQVQLGRDGWLYISQELKLSRDASGSMNTRADAVIALAKALKARGITLVIAPVPDKARIHPEHLMGTFPAALESGYNDFVSKLELGGVQVSHLDVPLKTAAKTAEVYYRTDTHWNMVGARVAARALATTVKSLGFDLPATKFVTTKALTAAPRIGDLIRLMSLDSVQTPWRPASDLEAPEKTSSLASANLGLLGAPSAQVVLVGTSYSLRGNFQGALQESLGTAVLNLAKEGSGFEKRMSAYLNDPALKNNPPKVLIWEFNERFLYLPIDGDLPALNASKEK